ncbi:MAG: glycosyltransferase family 4 protein [Pirellulales bacterium]|nr:glycosyltransferase family 4 protein [Pirellulales bacterium]
MPRLLIVCEYPTVLGGERSMLATLPATRQAGFDVIVAAPPDGPLAQKLNEHGVTHAHWQTASANTSRYPLEYLREKLGGIIRTVGPALLHANSLSTSRIAGRVAREHRIPSIGHLRDIVKLTEQAVADLNQHTKLIAVSEATRDFHVAQGLDAVKCVVLYNGVDLTEFRPRSPTGYLHHELALPANDRFIAVIGQLGLRKGAEIAIDAALQVAELLPRLHWLIVGERTSNKLESHEFVARLHEIANRPILASRVHFLGSRCDIPQLLNECRMLVHPARQEPLGRVLLEAAASGLVVIATNVGGTPEIFPRTSNSAALVPPNDSSAIAQTVAKLDSNDCLRHSLAANARRRAEEAFDIRDAAQRLISIYQSLLP